MLELCWRQVSWRLSGARSQEQLVGPFLCGLSCGRRIEDHVPQTPETGCSKFREPKVPERESVDF